MNIQILSTAFFVSVLMWSCLPEDEEPAYEPAEDSPVFVGLIGSEFSSETFDPPLSIQMTWDEQNLYGFGIDSLDFDADLSFDCFIRVYDLNGDSLHILDTQMPSPFPKVSVELRNGYDLAEETVSFPIGMGQSGEARFAARFEVNANLAVYETWLEGDSIRRDLWTESPEGSMNPQGPWYEVAAIHYLGFRKGNREGWIEINASDYRHPTILRWAME